MSRTLIVLGAVIIILGLLWPWLGRLPLGNLPGDIVIRRDGFTFYMPITTMVVVSVVVSVVLWLLGR